MRGARRWTLAALVPLIGVGWLYLRPLLESRPEQDACSFGTISNEHYRELLAEAKRRQANDWPRLSGTREEMNRNLTRRLEDMMRGMTSVDVRIAAAHAVARALGAEYRPGNIDKETFYKGSFGRFPPEVVFFSYVLDVHGIGGFYPLQRLAKLHLIFDVHVPPDVMKRHG